MFSYYYAFYLPYISFIFDFHRKSQEVICVACFFAICLALLFAVILYIQTFCSQLTASLQTVYFYLLRSRVTM